MEKVFYQYKYEPSAEPVKGTVIKETDTSYIINFDSTTYTVPKKHTRDPWEPHMWEFYKQKGFYKSPWFHGGFIIWFFLFIY